MLVHTQKSIPEIHYWVKDAVRKQRGIISLLRAITQGRCVLEKEIFYLFYCYCLVIQHQPWIQGQGPSCKIRKFISRGGIIFLQPSVFQPALKWKFAYFNQCLSNLRNNGFSVIFATHGTGATFISVIVMLLNLEGTFSLQNLMVKCNISSKIRVVRVSVSALLVLTKPSKSVSIAHWTLLIKS